MDGFKIAYVCIRRSSSRYGHTTTQPKSDDQSEKLNDDFLGYFYLGKSIAVMNCFQIRGVREEISLPEEVKVDLCHSGNRGVMKLNPSSRISNSC